MQVVVFKSYEKRSEIAYNYGDDYEVVWHNFNSLEKVMELSDSEYEELLRAIAFFNSKKKQNYVLKSMIIMEDNEVHQLLSDFRSYEQVEAAKAAKAAEALKTKQDADRIKRETAKVERSLKKLAKDLNLSIDEVRAKFS